MSQIIDANEKLNTLISSAEPQRLLDKSAFENLVNETSPDVVYDILNSYKNTLQESIDKLDRARELSPDDLYKVCHKLKGSSLLIGFNPLGERCVTAMTGLRESEIDRNAIDGRVQDVLKWAKDTQAVVLRTII